MLRTINGWLEHFSCEVARVVGTSQAFATAVAVVLAWAATGPSFHFGERWQLVINTGTTIITFLMCFVIQRSQAKDMRALHLKLDVSSHQ